jgi:hypothetical protein
MKTALKTIVIGIAACAFAAPASAYTINGTVAGNSRNWTAIHLQKPPSPNGYLKLTLSAPPANVGVGYSVGFCIALASMRASSPCPAISSTEAGLLVVPGQPTIVFIDANTYPNYVVWVRTGLRAAVPYSLDVDYVP